jgi:hypothetical protein
MLPPDSKIVKGTRAYGSKSPIIFYPREVKGQLIPSKLLFYDIETVRYNDDLTETDNLPDLSDVEDPYIRESMMQDWLANHPLNVKNLTQIGFMMPSGYSKANTKNALALTTWYEEREIEGELYTVGIIGGALDMLPAEVARRWVLFRGFVKLNAIGFNNLRFDAGVITKLAGINDDLDVSESHTHKLTIRLGDKRFNEFDINKWALALGARNLKGLGDIVGCKKLEMRCTNQSDFDEYNIRDCEIVLRTVLLLNGLKLGEDAGIRHHNMPSYVRGKFSDVFIKKQWVSVHTPKTWHQFEGYGARSECLMSDLSRCAYVDANSLYPTVMSSCLYPKFIEKKSDDGNYAVADLRKVPKGSLGWHNFHKNIKLISPDLDFKNRQARYHEVLGDRLFIAKVRISACADCIKHIFPYGYKEDGLTLFRFNPDILYEVYGYELIDLNDCTYTIESLHECKAEVLPFASMIREIYALRKDYKKQGSPLQYLMKILLNAGFGIWGARGDRPKRDNTFKTREVFARIDKECATIGMKKIKDIIVWDAAQKMDIRLRRIGMHIYTVAEDLPRFVKSSIPSISQFTLSHSRALMYSAMRILQKAGVQIRYTDTDSLIMDAAGLDIMTKAGLIGDAMGQFKLEYMLVNGHAVASKLYAFTVAELDKETAEESLKTVIVSKGVKQVGAVSKSFQTSAADELKCVERTVSKHDTRTKRKLLNGVFVNEFGTKTPEFYQVLLKLAAMEAVIKPNDPDLINEWTIYAGELC